MSRQSSLRLSLAVGAAMVVLVLGAPGSGAADAGRLAPLATSPSPRQAMGMAWDPAAKNVVLFGGTDTTGVFKGDTWTWSGTSWTQRFPPPPLPCPRHSTRMVYDNHGHVVMFGGDGYSSPDCLSGSEVTLSDTWLWEGVHQTWTQWCPTCPTHPTQRGSEGLAYDTRSDKVALFGGVGSPVTPPDLGDVVTPLDDTWLWDGATQTWCGPDSGCPISGVSPCKRGSAAMSFDVSRNLLMMFGGKGNLTDCGVSLLNDTWTFNSTTRTWSLCTSCNPNGLSSRTGHRMAWDFQTHTAVLFGGCTANCGPTNPTLVNDTWEIDGGPWRLCDPALGRCTTRPAIRCCTGLAYDSVRKKVVLFGGASGPFPNAYGDTWVWNGNNWSCAVAPCS